MNGQHIVLALLGIVSAIGLLFAMRYHTQHVAALLDVYASTIMATVDAREPMRRGPATVMLIEDDAPTRRMVTTVLSTGGYTVRALESAEAALASMVSAGLPDLLVVDIRLAEMSGLELARQLRHVGCRMPILAYSASYASGELAKARAEAVEAGCNAFVQKTGDAEVLLRQVARWLALVASVH